MLAPAAPSPSQEPMDHVRSISTGPEQPKSRQNSKLQTWKMGLTLGCSMSASAPWSRCESHHNDSTPENLWDGAHMGYINGLPGESILELHRTYMGCFKWETSVELLMSTLCFLFYMTYKDFSNHRNVVVLRKGW